MQASAVVLCLLGASLEWVVSSASTQSATASLAALATANMAEKRTAAAAAGQKMRTSESQQLNFWPFDAISGSDEPWEAADADLPVPTWVKTEAMPKMINVPGEGRVEDEVEALSRPRHRALLGALSQRTQTSHGSLAAGLASMVDTATSSQNEEQARGQNSKRPRSGPPLNFYKQARPRSLQPGAFPAHQKVLEEYDEIPDPDAPAAGVPRGPVQVVKGEVSTREERIRQHAGDIDHNQPYQQSIRGSPRPSTHRVAAMQQEVRSSDANVADKKSSTGSAMMAQCMAFASWLKAQGVQGQAFIRMWKGTCAGGTGGYTTMCNALGGAVSKYAFNPGWAPPVVCQAVISVFEESGVGATPLGA